MLSNFKKRVPFVEQMEQTECGLCCIAMVTGYYGYHPSLSELQQISGSGRDGLSMKTLKSTLNEIGMDSKALRIDIKDIKNNLLPMICYWGNNHFVVLESVKVNKFVILDPAIGRRILKLDEFYSNYSGVSLISIPNNKFIKKDKKNNWSYVLKLVGKHQKNLITVLVISAIVQLAALTTPIAVQLSVDNIGSNLDLSSLYIFGIVLFVIFLGEFIFSLIRARVLVYLKIKIDWSLMNIFFSKILSLPFKFFQVRTFGDIILRANSNILIREAISTQVITAILDIGLLLILTFYMFSQSTILALITVLFATINILLLALTAPKVSQLSKDELLKQTKVQSLQAETIYGIQSIRVSAMEKKVHNDWKEKFQAQLETTKKKELLNANVNTISNSIETLTRFSLLWIGLYMAYQEQISLGAAVAFFTLVGLFFSPIISLVNSFNSLFTINAYLNRIMDVIDNEDEKNGKLVIDHKLNGYIKLNNVYFSYGKEDVLRGLTFNILPGEKIAIVGPSGAGKSTLGRLIVGLYEPNFGEIYFDNYSLNELDKRSLRKQLSYVPQEVNLYTKTIYDNIAFNNERATEKEVHQAARLARIHQEIIDMPMQYQTLVSENGLNLSGGQKQRIVLARALVNDPSILLLDEATSSLDNINESKIELALNSLSCTRIIIAHRLSTIQNADKILFLDQGVIVETGNHEELIKLKGKYYQYYHEKFTLSDNNALA